jgi:4-hydroxy-3-methylbut-2-enyl diphosphate reductase
MTISRLYDFKKAELKSRGLTVIDTTCPFVKRAQMVARRLAENGFWVVVFGDAKHPEVKGILGWAQEKGIATLNVEPFRCYDSRYRRLGILAQTTQVPENFNDFAKEMIDLTLRQDSELRFNDTICHGIRIRQSASLELASKVDLMLVVGGRSSANTRRLVDLCSAVTEAHLISTAGEIDTNWVRGKQTIGVTSGTSTGDQDIDEVVRRLEEIDCT